MDEWDQNLEIKLIKAENEEEYTQEQIQNSAWDHNSELKLRTEKEAGENSIDIADQEIYKINDDESIVVMRRGQTDETSQSNFNYIVKIKNGSNIENIEMWKHFVSLDNGSALCGHCSKIFNTKKTNSMTKLIHHLKDNHDRHTEPVVMKAMKTYNKSATSESKHKQLRNVKKSYSRKSLNLDVNIRQPMTTVHNSPFTTIHTAYPSSSSQINIQDATQQIPKTLWKHYVYIDNNAKCGYCGISISLKQNPEVFKKLVDHLLSRHKVTIDREIIDEYMKSIMPNEPIAPPLKIAKVNSLQTEFKIEFENELAIIPSNEIQNDNQIINDTIIIDSEIVDQTQSSIMDVELPIIENWDGQFNHEIVVRMIIKNYYNLTIINDSNFDTFISNIDPKYKLMANITSLESHHLNKLHEKLKKELQDKFINISAITLTVEEFGLNDGRTFIDFKAHFIDEKCLLQSNTLECMQAPESCNKMGLSNGIKKTLAEWQIAEKLVTVVLRPDKLGKSNDNDIICFSYVLETIVKRALNEISTIVETIRQVASIFRTHETAGIDFKNIQNIVNPALPSIIVDDHTNWISTYYMLVRFLENKEALENYQPLFFVPELINSEWIILEHVCNICEIFEQIIKDMSDGKYVMLSKVIFYIDCISNFTNMYSSTNSTFLPSEITQIISIITNEIINYKLTNLHLESSLLDPRFKKSIFSNYKHFQVAYESVCKIANNIVMPTEEELVEHPTNKKSLWYLWDLKFAETQVNENKEKGKNELDKYLREPLLSRASDPLQWWKSREAFYPRLYQIMLNRMCIVANTVPANRLISESEIKLIKRRKNITKAIRKYVFINGNIS